MLHPRETAKTVTIFDVDGLSLGSVAGEPLEFIRRASHVMQVRKNEGKEIRRRRRRRRKKTVAKGGKEGAKRRVWLLLMLDDALGACTAIAGSQAVNQVFSFPLTPNSTGALSRAMPRHYHLQLPRLVFVRLEDDKAPC